MLLFNLKKDFKTYGICLLCGVGLFVVLFALIFIQFGFDVDLRDHSIRFMIFMLSVLSFGLFFSMLQFYVLFEFLNNRSEFKDSFKKQYLILLFIISFIIELAVFIFLFTENRTVIFIITSLIFANYVILGVRYFKMKQKIAKELVS